jgi:hypothetical protein
VLNFQPNISEQLNWTTQTSPTYAKCFILSIPDNIKKLRILNVNLEVNQESHIFLLHPGQFLNPDSKSKVEAKLEQHLSIDVEHTVSSRGVRLG